jgi:hypothetical protein
MERNNDCQLITYIHILLIFFELPEMTSICTVIYTFLYGLSGCLILANNLIDTSEYLQSDRRFQIAMQ